MGCWNPNVVRKEYICGSDLVWDESPGRVRGTEGQHIVVCHSQSRLRRLSVVGC